MRGHRPRRVDHLQLERSSATDWPAVIQAPRNRAGLPISRTDGGRVPIYDSGFKIATKPRNGKWRKQAACDHALATLALQILVAAIVVCCSMRVHPVSTLKHFHSFAALSLEFLISRRHVRPKCNGGTLLALGIAPAAEWRNKCRSGGRETVQSLRLATLSDNEPRCAAFVCCREHRLWPDGASF